jgi:predicted DNA-binding protein with PD1-like motif
MDFEQDSALFRIFANPFEASYEVTELTSQLELINLQGSAKLKGNALLKFYSCHPEDDYPNLQ